MLKQQCVFKNSLDKVVDRVKETKVFIAIVVFLILSHIFLKFISVLTIYALFWPLFLSYTRIFFSGFTSINCISLSLSPVPCISLQVSILFHSCCNILTFFVALSLHRRSKEPMPKYGKICHSKDAPFPC